MEWKTRLCVTAVAAAVGYWAFLRLRELFGLEAGIHDFGKIAPYLGLFLVSAFIAGAVLLKGVLSAFGELMGNAVYGSNESLEPDPHHDANAALARGDFPAAEAAYRKIIAKQPGDSLAVVELARLLAEKVGDPLGAREVLEVALEREWPLDEAGSLAMRLAELCVGPLADLETARAIWGQLIEQMPGTRHAANAATRLRELGQMI